jgi:hypothetical protein
MNAFKPCRITLATLVLVVAAVTAVAQANIRIE